VLISVEKLKYLIFFQKKFHEINKNFKVVNFVHLYSEPQNHHSYGPKKAQLLTVKGLTGGTR